MLALANEQACCAVASEERGSYSSVTGLHSFPLIKKRFRRWLMVDACGLARAKVPRHMDGSLLAVTALCGLIMRRRLVFMCATAKL